MYYALNEKNKHVARSYKMTQMTKLINSSLLICLKDLESVSLMKNFIIFGLASYTRTRRNFWPMTLNVF